jgi:hypothetical protein
LIYDRRTDANHEPLIPAALDPSLRRIRPKLCDVQPDRLARPTRRTLRPVKIDPAAAIPFRQPLVELFRREHLDRMSIRQPRRAPRQIGTHVRRVEDNDLSRLHTVA